MTTKFYHRCINCGVEYCYQASGSYAPKFNHNSYCHTCFEACIEALQKIPRKFECRYQNVQNTKRFIDITLEQVLRWEKENDEKEGTNLFRRIFPGLINIETGDYQNVREVKGREQFSGIPFQLSTWQDSHEYEIKVPMAYDLTCQCYTNELWR